MGKNTTKTRIEKARISSSKPGKSPAETRSIYCNHSVHLAAIWKRHDSDRPQTFQKRKINTTEVIEVQQFILYRHLSRSWTTRKCSPVNFVFLDHSTESRSLDWDVFVVGLKQYDRCGPDAHSHALTERTLLPFKDHRPNSSEINRDLDICLLLYRLERALTIPSPERKFCHGKPEKKLVSESVTKRTLLEKTWFKQTQNKQGTNGFGVPSCLRRASKSKNRSYVEGANKTRIDRWFVGSHETTT